MSTPEPGTRQVLATDVVYAFHSKDVIGARLVCPWCGDRIATTLEGSSRGTPTGAVGLLRCPSQACGEVSLAYLKRKSVGFEHIALYPSNVSRYAPPGVPTGVAAAYREACDSRAAGHLSAAALVGRRALQKAIRTVVSKRGRLVEEIAAVPSDLFTASVREAAHEVRLIGNAAAHPDQDEIDDSLFTEADVDDLLNFVERVLDVLFVLPEKLKARKRPAP